MGYKVSVIVPIHNVAEFLGEALDSLVSQTIGVENLQVIMVDDGSTDESAKIMKRYAKANPNFVEIYLPTASGAAGHPRNVGLEVAEAEYVMFLDPDDYYATDACENMYNAIVKYNVDVVTANYNYMEEDGTIWPKAVFDTKRFTSFKFGNRSFDKSFFIWNSAVWNKIFSKKVITDKKIKFLEGVPGEDAYFSYAALLNSESAYYISNTVYYYRRRSNSGTLSISWNRSIDYFQKINYAYKRIYELFEKTKKLDLFRYFYSKTLTSVFYKLVDTKYMNDEEKAQILEEMSWLYNARTKLKIEPCQKSLNIVLDMVKEGKYKEAVDVCKIIAEMREYVPKDVRENMSKPENVQYEDLETEDKK